MDVQSKLSVQYDYTEGITNVRVRSDIFKLLEVRVALSQNAQKIGGCYKHAVPM